MKSMYRWKTLAVLLLLLKIMIIVPNTAAAVSSSPSSFHLGRHLLQAENISESEDDDTVRVDPLNHLKKYRGGYDISSKNYWSSTAFTGIYGYAIAGAWVLGGLVYGVYFLVASFLHRNSRGNLKKNGSPCHQQCYVWPVLVAVLFTAMAIIGCGIVLGGVAKFHSRAKTVVDILIDTADDASDTLYNTSTAMKDMNRNLASLNETGDITDFLTSTSTSLDDQASDIRRQARKNRRAIDKGLKIVYIVTCLIISLSLAAAIAISAVGILKLPRTLRILIVICWILTLLCWVFFGLYYFIYNFADDTCTAMEGFQEDPYDNSLSSLLPCDELLSARSILTDLSAQVHDVVNEVNRNISTTYGNIAQICNPFSAPPEYQYQPQECQPNTIQIGDIPQLLSLVACPDSEGSTCTGGIKIPARDYNLVVGYTSSIQRLLYQYPRMESLVECQTVTSAFSDILHSHCKPLKRYGKMVWAAMAFLSVVMVPLVLLWTYEAHYQKEYRSGDSSVKPYFSAAENLESGVLKEVQPPHNAVSSSAH